MMVFFELLVDQHLLPIVCNEYSLDLSSYFHYYHQVIKLEILYMMVFFDAIRFRQVEICALQEWQSLSKILKQLTT